ncbi:MAG: hypothetical protein J0M10_11545 [Chitinophagales bacterium]|nr:hypothetical protein [Chitinophagales bacterium]
MKPILVVLLALVLFSCNSKKAAFNFSEAIVAKEKSLTADITMTEEKVKQFFGEDKMDSMAAVSERMVNKVQSKIDEIQEMKTPDAKGAAGFKEAALKYFKFIRSVYVSYKDVAQAKTDEARQQLVEAMQENLKRKDAVIEEMQKEQRGFAKDNGFKVQ